MSFSRKRLRITFTLANNAKFEGTNSNVLVLEGYRARVYVKSAGDAVAPSANLQVYGVRQSDMNALTMLNWQPLGLQRNRVRVEANDGLGFATVFFGDIISSGPDYASAPDVFLGVQAVTAYVDRLRPVDPTSYTGTTDVATVINDIAIAMGYNFEDNGVNIKVNAPYLVNTLGERLRKFCFDAGVDLYIDSDTIAITLRGRTRRGQPVELNAKTGLIGYPTIDINGLQVQALYNPGFQFGGQVRISGSDVPRANGNWKIYTLDHDLQSEQPGGSWFSYMSLSTVERFAQARS